MGERIGRQIDNDPKLAGVEVCKFVVAGERVAKNVLTGGHEDPPLVAVSNALQ